MVNLRRVSALAVLAGLLVMLTAVIVADEQRVEAAITTIELQMTGAQEVPPVTSPGSVFARLTFDDVTREVGFALTVSGLSPDQVTGAHIHRGAAGTNGPIIHPFSNTGFTIVSGKVTLSEAEVADLRAGNLYVNAHSIAHPGGFARAQIILPEQGVRATIQRAVDAWNRKDVEGVLAQFTDSGLAASFDGATRAELRQFLPEFIGEPPLRLIAIGPVSSTGTSASAVVDLAFGIVLSRERFTFVLEGNVWKISDTEELSEPIPPGVRAVDVRMGEFFFGFDRSAFSDGNVALVGRNIGRQDHELILVRLNTSLSLEELLAVESEGPPPGVEDIAQDFFMPGETKNMVFTQALANGRYAMLCFVPDEATGTPHALLGMAAEFVIGPGAGAAPAATPTRTAAGPVSPPRTGDAGLASDETSSLQPLLLALGGAIVVAGVAGVAVSRRRA